MTMSPLCVLSVRSAAGVQNDGPGLPPSPVGGARRSAAVFGKKRREFVIFEYYKMTLYALHHELCSSCNRAVKPFFFLLLVCSPNIVQVLYWLTHQ